MFGVDGVARSVTMCRCSGCARSFPEEYPVDTSTWCALMGMSSCGGDCVPADTDCAFEGGALAVRMDFGLGCGCSYFVAQHVCSQQCLTGGALSWCEWAGIWRVAYSNGFTTIYNISAAGVVIASQHDGAGVGTLAASDAYECPGRPCARLTGIYARGKEEFLTLRGGRLVAEHYTPGHCCTGDGARVGGASSACDADRALPFFSDTHDPESIALRLIEGANASYRVQLQSAPTDAVTIRVSVSGDDSRVPNFDQDLVLDAQNWRTGLEVALIALNDNFNADDLRPTIVTHALTTSDILFGRLRLPNVRVTVVDNDELVLPRHLEMGTTRTGPVTGGTVVDLRYPSDEVYGHDFTQLLAGVATRGDPGFSCRIVPRYARVAPDAGPAGFNELFRRSPNGVIRAVCPSCNSSHQEVFYARLSGTAFDPHLSMRSPFRAANHGQIGLDWGMFSTYADALARANPWPFSDAVRAWAGFLMPSTELYTENADALAGAADAALDGGQPRLLCAVPPAERGPASVAFRVGDLGWLPADREFTYLPLIVPVVTDVHPRHAPVDPRDNVTISGDNFDAFGEILYVRFGEAVVEGQVVEGGGVTVRPPARAFAQRVAVAVSYNAGDWVDAGVEFSFTPVLTGASPSSGPASGGTALTISGRGFSRAHDVITCRFGDAATSVAHFLSATRVLCTAPAAAGPARALVSVASDDGHFSSDRDSVAFDYVAPAEVRAIAPASLSVLRQRTVELELTHDPAGAATSAPAVGLIPLHSETGTSRSDAARSCADVLAASPDAATGQYWLRPDDDVEPFQGLCDMTTDGGGWLVLSVNGSSSPCAAALQSSAYETWSKCDDDAAEYYDGISEGDVNPAVGSSVTFPIAYANPEVGYAYTADQMRAIRLSATELARATRAVVTTTGANNVTAIFREPGGAERAALLSPGRGPNCGDYGHCGYGPVQLSASAPADVLLSGGRNISESIDGIDSEDNGWTLNASGSVSGIYSFSRSQVDEIRLIGTVVAARLYFTNDDEPGSESTWEALGPLRDVDAAQRRCVAADQCSGCAFVYAAPRAGCQPLLQPQPAVPEACVAEAQHACSAAELSGDAAVARAACEGAGACAYWPALNGSLDGGANASRPAQPGRCAATDEAACSGADLSGGALDSRASCEAAGDCSYAGEPDACAWNAAGGFCASVLAHSDPCFPVPEGCGATAPMPTVEVAGNAVAQNHERTLRLAVDPVTATGVKLEVRSEGTAAVLAELLIFGTPTACVEQLCLGVTCRERRCNRATGGCLGAAPDYAEEHGHETSVYLWHTTYDGNWQSGSSAQASHTPRWPVQFLIPDAVALTAQNGGSSFGWQSSRVLLRKPLVPSLVLNATLVAGRAGAAPRVQFSTPADTSTLPRDAFAEVSFNGQQFSRSQRTISLFNPALLPEVTAVTPRAGPKEGGTRITVRGSNFADVGSLACQFQGDFTYSAPAHFLTSTSVTCETPGNGAGAATVPGFALVRVTNNGTDHSTGTQAVFQYTATSPASSTASGPGISGALSAGDVAVLTIVARTAGGSARTSGGDVFALSVQQVCSARSPCRENDEGESTPFRGAGAGVVDLDDSMGLSLEDRIEAALSRSSSSSALTRAEIASGLDTSTQLAGEYRGMWKATVSGEYSISVSSGGEEVAGSPFTVMVTPLSIDVGTSELLGFFTAAEAGLAQTVHLQPRDVFGNTITDSSIDRAAGGTSVVDRIDGQRRRVDVAYELCLPYTAGFFERGVVPCEVSGLTSLVAVSVGTQAVAGAVPITVHTEAAGQFVVRASLGGVPLAGDGARVAFFPARTHGPASIVVGRLDRFVAGLDAALVMVDTRDRYGNSREVGGDQLTLAATCESTGAVHEAAPTDLQNSSYAFVYSPTVAGLYSIEIRVTATPADFLGGEVVQVAGAASLVGGRLHPSVVLPAPLDVPSCTVSGPGTVAATAGHAAPLIIQGRDQWSNMRTQDDGPFSYALHATRLSQSAASLSEVDVSGDAVYDASGRYLVSFNATLAGSYQIEISSGCPADDCTTRFGDAVTVVPARTHAATSLASGAGLLDSVAGDSAAFIVHLRDRFGNGRASGGEGAHLTLHPDRVSRLQEPFWSDLMRAGLEFPETRSVQDMRNGSYLITHRLVPAMDYQLRIVYNASREWPELHWPSRTVPPVDDLERREFLLFGSDAFRGDLVTGRAHRLTKTPRPPPEVLWTKFDDSLIRMRVKFSNATDLANMTRGSPCNNVIHSNMLPTLGENPMCSWATADELVISLGHAQRSAELFSFVLSCAFLLAPANSRNPYSSRSGALIVPTRSYNYQNDPEAFLDWNGLFAVAPEKLKGFFGNTEFVADSAIIGDPDNPVVSRHDIAGIWVAFFSRYQ